MKRHSLCLPFAYAQAPRASSHGIARLAGVPVPDVYIHLRGKGDDKTRIALSGIDGFYQVTDLAPGLYEVSASKYGSAPAKTIQLADLLATTKGASVRATDLQSPPPSVAPAGTPRGSGITLTG